jgi:putative heme iron utilization protein
MARTPAEPPAEPDAAVPDDAALDPGVQVRRLLRTADRAMLATVLARDGSGRPYASLVLSAVDHDVSPILLVSNLADHTRNLAADPRASLLYDGTAGHDDPLMGARASVLGTVREVTEAAEAARLKARFVARHPGAKLYADFADFRILRLEIESAHLVAGFGRIHWLEAAEVVFPTAACAALAASEAAIVDHMNADHGEALDLIVRLILRAPVPEPEAHWTMTGIDPEGIDLRRGAWLARAAFAAPVSDADEARAAFVRMARRARDLAGSESA